MVLVPTEAVATAALEPAVGRGANGEATIGVRITCGAAVGRTMVGCCGCGLNTAITGLP